MPTVESARPVNSPEAINVSQDIAGIHIRFIPENEKGDELTSRKFKDLCVFNVAGIIEVTTITEGDKKKRYRKLVPLNTWEQEHEQNGGGGDDNDGD